MRTALDDATTQALLDLARSTATTGLVVTRGGRVLLDVDLPLPDDVTFPPGVRRVVQPDGRSREDVASAQKSVVSVLVTVATSRGLLDLDAPVTEQLGAGWSRAEPQHERAISLRHLMSMTSGLDDVLASVAAPGQVWDYNLGAAYHLVKRVLVAAAGTDLDALTRAWLLEPLGLTDTAWLHREVPSDLPPAARPYACYPDGAAFEGLMTTARDLATFGEAVLAALRGERTDSGLAVDTALLRTALSPSSTLNPAYGLLWWVNGRDWHLTPKDPQRREGWLVPAAPADLVAALGMLGRSVHVVPSLDLVVVRLGADPGEGGAVSTALADRMWQVLLDAPGVAALS